VVIRLSLGNSEVAEWGYTVVCKQEKLKGFDVSTLLLFVISVSLVSIGIKKEPYRLIKELSPEEKEQMKIGSQEAWLMLFGASSFLLCLYFFMDYIVQVLTIIVCLFSANAIGVLVDDLLNKTVSEKNKLKEINLYLDKVRLTYVAGFAVGLCIVTVWFFTRNWFICNVIASILVLISLKTIEIETLPPGLLLLSLLFFYDIFMVFVTPFMTKSGDSVMMYVAQNLDLPIKIMMPHITIDYPSSNCSLIGLGDLIIPGIYISYVSRFGSQVALSESYFIT